MVVFNGITRQIEVTDPGIVSLDVELDIYSAWKDWSLLSDNSKYAPALRTFGGDQTIEGQFAPKYFFLTNYWQVLVNNGNVVSVELNLYTDDYDTPYVVLAGSGVSDRNSDAVSINSETIEFSSFNGGVTIDLTNKTGLATDGIYFPIGTGQAPCDNLPDAALIAAERGFTKIYVLGDATIDDSQSWEGFEFEGESSAKSLITVLSAAEVVDCEFYQCTLSGTLDGNSQIERAVVDNLYFVDGLIFQCAIGPTTITLGTSTTANIFSSYSTIPGEVAPIIDMNAEGILGLRDYNGGIKLINYTGSGSHSIDLASGQVILDSTTVLSGTFVVRGVGKLVDENGTHIPSGTWNNNVTILNELTSGQGCEDSQPVTGSVEYDARVAIQQI